MQLRKHQQLAKNAIGKPKTKASLSTKLTAQKLFTSKLNTLKITTNMIALIFALKPTTTITHATNPSKLTMTLAKVHSPATTKPKNKKISRILPAN